MVTSTASTVTDPSLTRIDDSRSRGRTSASLRTSANWCFMAGSRGGRFNERVADPVHGLDVPGLGRLVAELAPDARDVAVDHPAPGVVPVAPDPLHELLPSEHHARGLGQGEEDLELEWGH